MLLRNCRLQLLQSRKGLSIISSGKQTKSMYKIIFTILVVHLLSQIIWNFIARVRFSYSFLHKWNLERCSLRRKLLWSHWCPRSWRNNGFQRCQGVFQNSDWFSVFFVIWKRKLESWVATLLNWIKTNSQEIQRID